eukprot:TRINITY_DN4275_c0_g1_i1.p1 TRINITY_DN4275_c0_g1~~TRINITY_DN4275_c0_g1_i1.p1  ORF type:complete len:128 (+),score=23.85 TRINITY_DN4275_c0_g1_i1:402-785(+)
MLQMISEAGSGKYYYIETIDMTIKCFGDTLDRLLSLTGEDLRLTIEAAAEGLYVIKKVHGVRNEIVADGSRVVVSLGDLQAEEARHLIEVGLPSLDSAHDDSRAVFKASLTSMWLHNLSTGSLQQLP